MTSPKPLVVNRAQLLRDAEWYDDDARRTRNVTQDFEGAPGYTDNDMKEIENEALRSERTAQVLRAVAEAEVRDASNWNDGEVIIVRNPGCVGNAEPCSVLIIPVEGEEGA